MDSQNQLPTSVKALEVKYTNFTAIMLADNGYEGYYGDVEPATKVELNHLFGVTISCNDKIYIALCRCALRRSISFLIPDGV